ncbi:hypothetical protein [Thermodesulfobacterium hydrogeniphilum]|uniref:hypothetical protein n=1 Tax=Thermodesulfobacterium hydrogeniphilum TaxID=161156 RepID=UPI00056F9085|nr:hypothetical protein [Thermodesulfobacterium hydrogeniphilum]
MKGKLFSFLIFPIILTGIIFISKVSFINIAKEDFKCLKCHKGSKSLENIVKEKHITSADQLKYLIRKGPKSGLHITVPDKDLEKAIEYLHLKYNVKKEKTKKN